MQVAIQGLSLVLRGDFVPPLLHPGWLLSKNLIRPSDDLTMRVKLIHSDVAVYENEWMGVRIETTRLHLLTNEFSHFEILRDLLIGIMSHLDDDAVRQLGINREFHCRVGSRDELNAIGWELVPADPWEGFSEPSGMVSLTMDTVRQEADPGYVRIRVEPSTRMEPGEYGVFVHINDHYELTEFPSQYKLQTAIEILMNRWDESMQRSLDIATSIYELRGNS